MEKYVCKVCGYIYDPEKGDSTQNIALGTAFEDLPEHATLHHGDPCPECGVGKDMFEKQAA